MINDSRNTTELDTILKGIKSVGHQMNMKCTGCRDVDENCNCTLELLRENEISVQILLDTTEGPKWCPSSTVDSMYFNCQPGSFMKIRASQVCNGFFECPGKEDEADILCRSSSLPMLTSAVVPFRLWSSDNTGRPLFL